MTRLVLLVFCLTVGAANAQQVAGELPPHIHPVPATNTTTTFEASLLSDTTSGTAYIEIAPNDRPGPSPSDETTTRFFVTGGGVLGIESVGARFVGGVRTRGPEAWSFPLALEVQALQVANESRNLEATFWTYGPVLQAAYQPSDATAAVQFGLQITGGNEEISSRQGGFIFGGRLSVEVVAVPSRTGLMGTIGVYGTRMFGSVLYPADIGGTATVGIIF